MSLHVVNTVARERDSRSKSSCARTDEPGLVGKNDGLNSIAEAELHQYALDVRLDGRSLM
jgi:hypothetical protein